MKTQPSFLILAFISAVTSISFSCGDKPEPGAAIRPVRYVEVYSTGGTRTRTFSGVAKAGIESNLSFKVPGTVQNILVKVGDSVRAENSRASGHARPSARQAMQNSRSPRGRVLPQSGRA